MLKKAPTLQDVATLAGVSRMAASAVLNDAKSTIRVSESTRDRIFAAMAELRYQPDENARSLRLQRANAIGFYNGYGSIDTLDPFAPNIFHGLQSATAELSNSLLLYNGYHLQPEEIVRTKLLSSKTDGVVIWPTPRDENLILSLKRSRKPFVQIAESYPGLPSVTTDDEAGARSLAEHLAQRGHMRVLYRRGILPLLSETNRFHAFASSATALGMTMIESTPHDALDHLSSVEQDLIQEHGGAVGITAVACWHDASAIQVVRHCREVGIRIPQDIAVTGFDGFEWRDCPEGSRLTTVAVEWQRIARVCVENLISRLKGGTEPERTVIAGSLRPGDTS